MMKDLKYTLILEQLRWNGKPCCPYCNSLQHRKLKGEQRYQCNECYTSYSVTVNTLFHQTHVDLEKWFAAIRLVLITNKTISVRELAKNSM
jgi:transposase-like protein